MRDSRVVLPKARKIQNREVGGKIESLQDKTT